MKIGIDARLYGVRHRGIGRYTQKLIEYLDKTDKENRFVIFLNDKDNLKLSLNKAKFKIVYVDASWYSFLEHLKMPYYISREGLDFMHFLHLNAPWWCPVPYVVTIHDLIVWHFPDSRATTMPKWFYNLKVVMYKLVLKNTVKKAKKIITVSRFSKRDLIKTLNIEENKVFVTDLGIEKQVLGTASMNNSRQFSSYLEEKFNISQPYLLYVGAAYPHKNLENLVKAFSLMKTDYQRNWQLVLVGRIDYFYQKIKNQIKLDKFLKDSIIFTGEVDEKDLDGLYRGARVFVFPSFYEGFGLPPLEAMSKACPVIAAKSSSLPEVLGDAALYFNPADYKEMAEVIEQAASSPKILEILKNKSIGRSKNFSWEKTAKQTIEIYSKIK